MKKTGILMSVVTILTFVSLGHTDERSPDAQAANAVKTSTLNTDDDVLKNGSQRLVLFDKGSSEINDMFHERLDNFVKYLNDHPTYTVELSGRADTRGNQANNSVLSQNRANAVLKYLTDKGISRDRLTAIGYGQPTGKAPDATRMGKQSFRSVYATVTEK